MTEEDIQVTVPEDDEVLEVSVDEPGGSGGGGVTEEVDPTVPAWAKQPQKPTYTAEEVGAQPKGDYVLRDELPDSGIPIPETAEVGQTIVVKAVDENGKPTEWECADIPPDWEVIADITTEEEVTSITIDKDTDGNPFDLIEGEVSISFGKSLSANANWWLIGDGSNQISLATHNYHILIRSNSLSSGAMMMIYDTWGGGSYRNLESWNKGNFNRFRIENHDKVMIPVGSKIKIVGRRKAT